MKNKGLHILSLLLLFAVTAVAQVPDEYLQRRQAAMDSLRQVRIDWEEQYWQKRRLYEAEHRPQRVKPTEQPTLSDTLKTDKAIHYELMQPSDTSLQQFEELSVGSMGKSTQVKVSFYGCTITFNVPEDKAPKQLASQLATHKRRYDLNDWGLLLLAQKVAAATMPSSTDDQAMLTVQMMNALHYDLRIGRMGTHYYAMVHTSYPLYEVPYMEADGKHYYALRIDSKQTGTLYSYDKQPADAVLPIDMRMKKSPQMGSGNLIDFYADYPLSDIRVQASAALSAELTKQMLQYSFANRKDTLACLNQLLTYVQSFDYKSDLEQFGREKYFFCEEMFHYPGSDCEDRAVLFAHMVQLLLGLDVVLVDYHDHMTTAVQLSIASSKGHYLILRNRRYYLCDPTFRGAKVGQLDKRFHKQKAKVINTKKD